MFWPSYLVIYPYHAPTFSVSTRNNPNLFILIVFLFLFLASDFDVPSLHSQGLCANIATCATPKN